MYALVCGPHERGLSRAYACALPQGVARHVVGYRGALEAMWLRSLVDRGIGHWRNV